MGTGSGAESLTGFDFSSVAGLGNVFGGVVDGTSGACFSAGSTDSADVFANSSAGPVKKAAIWRLRLLRLDEIRLYRVLKETYGIGKYFKHEDSQRMNVGFSLSNQNLYSLIHCLIVLIIRTLQLMFSILTISFFLP